MNWLKGLRTMNTVPVPRQTTSGESLEEKLAYLQHLGKPTLGIYTEGWHARCEIHVPHTGVTLTARSGFRHTTPTAAVDECIQCVKAMKPT